MMAMTSMITDVAKLSNEFLSEVIRTYWLDDLFQFIDAC